jgi:hypothetical protein
MIRLPCFPTECHLYEGIEGMGGFLHRHMVLPGLHELCAGIIIRKGSMYECVGKLLFIAHYRDMVSVFEDAQPLNPTGPAQAPVR